MRMAPVTDSSTPEQPPLLRQRPTMQQEVCHKRLSKSPDTAPLCWRRAAAERLAPSIHIVSLG